MLGTNREKSEKVREIHKTKKFDPFYKENPDTIILPGSEISFLKGGTTKINPYIIPIDITNENLGKTRNDLQGLYFLRKNRVIDYGGWFGLGEKNSDKFWGISERFNRLRIEIEIPIETSRDWITDSKNQVNIPDYARNKIRKSLIQVRKDYLEKVNLMNGENKEPINETLKKKNELIKHAESHQRNLYTGFLGFISPSSTRLYVNLRCCQLYDKKAVLYLGGGFTKDSTPNNEWLETEEKSKTLMEAIKAVNDYK